MSLFDKLFGKCRSAEKVGSEEMSKQNSPRNENQKFYPISLRGRGSGDVSTNSLDTSPTLETDR